MIEKRETYVPEILEEDRFRFDVYGGLRTNRILSITVLSVISTIILFSGIRFIVSKESFIRQLFLPADGLLPNSIQILITLFGLWVLVFAIDRFFFFSKRVKHNQK